MNVKTKYFHSIMPYSREPRENQFNEILHKLECILKEGYILPYKVIREKYPEIIRNQESRSNGDERISICLHNMNQQPIDHEYSMAHINTKMEYAFEQFVLESVSIVLNESLADNFKMYPRIMYMERQVEGSIPLKYMDAVSIDPTLEVRDYFSTKEKEERYCTGGHRYYTMEFLRRLKKLLLQYGYDVPIVSAWTGNEFHDVEQEETQNVK